MVFKFPNEMNTKIRFTIKAVLKISLRVVLYRGEGTVNLLIRVDGHIKKKFDFYRLYRSTKEIGKQLRCM